MNRRAFLKACGSIALLGGHGMAFTFSSQDLAPWLDRAREGIRLHRQSPCVIRVLDENGLPLRGADIRVRQLRHSFKFGSNCFRWQQAANPEYQAAYRARFARLFNQATLPFYWADYESQRGQPKHEQRDAIVDWCLERHIACKGHPLVWANIDDPPWLPDDPVAIHDASHARVRDLIARFQGRINFWDVVNEPSLLLWANTRYAAWAHAVGTRSFVAQHLRTARQANPAATLIVNEVLSPYPVYSILDDLRDTDGRPLYDAVGIQSHMHTGLWPLDRLWTLCDQFANLGVPLHFSEVSVLSGARIGPREWQPTAPELEETQADYVAKLYTLLFGHPAVREISWWDLTDLASWQNAPAGLLRADMSPKPAYERLDALINESWRTRADGFTNRRGEFHLRAFHGDYAVTARHRDGRRIYREINWHHNKPRVAELRFPSILRTGTEVPDASHSGSQ
jgi:GH35 family endo-1,4-beta-xylanase